MNEDIRFPQVRLVGENGEQLGIVSSNEANRIAEERSLDLVLISPNAEPPVCKVMDYGKFKFEQNKRIREQRKAQKVVEVKEVQLSMTIEMHDMQTKARHANKFLQEGDKVKVTIRMRGRQQARPEMGIGVMRQFFELINANGTIDKEPEILGRTITMIVVPSIKK
ncbi:MAG: translation initiation factor IF-3 [Christensenellaceae bacterium]|nr:translation initiation factor IF-3 [Christensenellaceae bacterium]